MMRHVREILRLSLDARLSTRAMSQHVRTGATTVRDTLRRFTRSGLSWPLPPEIGDADLEERLYGVPGAKPGRRKLPEPDCPVVARELKRKHVALQVLWEEYRAERPDGYRYSRFCDLFRRWEGRLPLVMRQSHAGGEKLFLDYAGDTVPVVVDRRTGEVRDAHIFVAVMGGSSLSFALATWTEQFPDWIAGNNAAFAFFRGVPQLLVPDYVPGHVIGYLCPKRLCAFIGISFSKWAVFVSMRAHRIRDARRASSILPNSEWRLLCWSIFSSSRRPSIGLWVVGWGRRSINM
jgi:transposase